MTKHEYISFGYLSGLKCHLSGLYNIDHTDNEKVNPITVEIVGINLREVEIHEIGRTITEHYEICDCFPILRPLSDLNKEMQDGRTYLQYFECMFDFESDQTCPIRMYINSGWTTTINELPFEIVIKLIEWHFDIAGLIDKGEAIDYHILPDFVF